MVADNFPTTHASFTLNLKNTLDLTTFEPAPGEGAS